jgi:hypothetical protein
VVDRPSGDGEATVEIARTNDKLVLIGGALGPRLDASGVRALAELPSLDRCAPASWG